MGIVNESFAKQRRRTPRSDWEKWRRTDHLSQAAAPASCGRDFSFLWLESPCFELTLPGYQTHRFLCKTVRVGGGHEAAVGVFTAAIAERLRGSAAAAPLQNVGWTLEKRWEKPAVRQEGGLQQHGARTGVTPGLLPEQNSHPVSTNHSRDLPSLLQIGEMEMFHIKNMFFSPPLKCTHFKSWTQTKTQVILNYVWCSLKYVSTVVLKCRSLFNVNKAETVEEGCMPFHLSSTEHEGSLRFASSKLNTKWFKTLGNKYCL